MRAKKRIKSAAGKVLRTTSPVYRKQIKVADDLGSVRKSLVQLARDNAALSDQNKQLAHSITELNARFNDLLPKLDQLKDEQKSNHETYRQLLKAGMDIEKLPKSKGVLRDIQDVSLQMLEEFEEICRKHKLAYWLDFGTLLGGVRHGGFIPWDDDMDVAMPITDYRKLLKVIDKELATTDFRFINVPSQIGKIVHKDFMPQGEAETAEFIHWTLKGKLSFALDIFPYYYAKQDLAPKQLADYIKLGCGKKAKIFEGKEHNYADFLRAQKEVAKYNDKIVSSEKTSLIFLGMETLVYQPRIVNAEDIFPLIKVSFEGHSFFAPRRVEDYLIDIYGDYMQFPDHPHTHLFLGSISREELKLLRKANRR